MRSLVIDDEVDARSRLIRCSAPITKFAVIGEAQDGLDAIEKIEVLRPDLLFLDIEMPGLKGFEVLRSIRPPSKRRSSSSPRGTISTPSRPSKPTRLLIS